MSGNENTPAAVQRDEGEKSEINGLEGAGTMSNSSRDVRLSDGELVEIYGADDGRVALRFAEGGPWHYLAREDVGPFSVRLIGAAMDAGAGVEDLEQAGEDPALQEREERAELPVARVPRPAWAVAESSRDDLDGYREHRWLGPEHGPAQLELLEVVESGAYWADGPVVRLAQPEASDNPYQPDVARRVADGLLAALRDLGGAA